MRLKLGIKCPRIIECQFFSFMPPIASAKFASTNAAASSLAANGARTVLYAGAACVKVQVDCLGVGVKIELDHGLINAPSCPLWAKSGHVIQSLYLVRSPSSSELRSRPCGSRQGRETVVRAWGHGCC